MPHAADRSKQDGVLMLGKGWFPAELGGLDRYFRELLTALPDASGVVIGPGPDAPSRVAVVADHHAPLVQRIMRFTAAAARRRSAARLVDIHFALYGLVPLLLSFRNLKVVVHFQGPWADESLVAGERDGWAVNVKRRLERVVYRRADVAITLTSAFKDILSTTYGVEPRRIVVLRPGVDCEYFSPGAPASARRALNLPERAFIVCCARRMVQRMGIDILLEAWSLSLASRPDARMIIAGDGPLESELRTRAEDLGLTDSVTLTGRLSDGDLLHLYRAADLNVVPTRSFEGFGLIVLEAAACGTPSVVTAVGGLPEAVEGLGPNLVVPPRDALALARRLESAYEGDIPTRAATRSWAASQNWQAVAERHRRLYASVLDGSV